MLGKLDIYHQSKSKPRFDLSLGDAVTELKYLVNQLSTFAIVNPSNTDLILLKEIVAVVEGMEIPEIIGGEQNSGEA